MLVVYVDRARTPQPRVVSFIQQVLEGSGALERARRVGDPKTDCAGAVAARLGRLYDRLCGETSCVCVG
jgi:hypothetical protein